MRRKKNEPLLSDIQTLMRQDAGAGISNNPEDWIWWLADEKLLRRPWLSAIVVIDSAVQANGTAKKADKKQLVELLKSGREITSAERVYLADLLDRHDFKRPAHRPTVPLYDLTPKAAALEQWAEKVRQLQKLKKMSREAALAHLYDQRSPPRGVDRTALESLLLGKHASARRTKTRRPKS
jgi:hypothetical protein